MRDWYMVQLDYRYQLNRGRFRTAKHPTPCAPPRQEQDRSDNTDTQAADMISEGCPHHDSYDSHD